MTDLAESLVGTWLEEGRRVNDKSKTRFSRTFTCNASSDGLSCEELVTIDETRPWSPFAVNGLSIHWDSAADRRAAHDVGSEADGHHFGAH